MICRVSGCVRKLRRDNQTGVCKTHRNKWGSCRRCLFRCDWRSTLCNRCHRKDRKTEAVSSLICWAEGCTKRVRSKSGYCRTHWLRGPLCKAPACTVYVIRTSRQGFCRAHDNLASQARYYAKRARLRKSQDDGSDRNPLDDVDASTMAPSP